MTDEQIKINNVLKEWNPIEVPEPALDDEYLSYVDDINKIRKNKEELVKYLENLLMNVIGLDYNPKSKDVYFYADKISAI